jgi:hypothetical protein
MNNSFTGDTLGVVHIPNLDNGKTKDHQIYWVDKKVMKHYFEIELFRGFP